MAAKVAKLLAFIGAYLKANWAIALEYRGSTISQVLGMCINDLLWLGFWTLYFTKFPVLRGWTLKDVLVLWATVPTSFGLVAGVLNNSLRIPQLVVQGQLDYYLALPKDVLLHLLVSRMNLANVGDLLFGPLVLLILVRPSLTTMVIFAAVSLLAAVVLMAFFITAGSLTFYLGNAETLGSQLVNAILHFATYPTSIFDNSVKVILFTLIPAGFVTTLPVELIRSFDWLRFLELLGVAAAAITLATAVFRAGLKRYESGNLMQMRS